MKNSVTYSYTTDCGKTYSAIISATCDFTVTMVEIDGNQLTPEV